MKKNKRKRKKRMHKIFANLRKFSQPLRKKFPMACEILQNLRIFAEAYEISQGPTFKIGIKL